MSTSAPLQIIIGAWGVPYGGIVFSKKIAAQWASLQAGKDMKDLGHELFAGYIIQSTFLQDDKPDASIGRIIAVCVPALSPLQGENGQEAKEASNEQ